jgi:tetratricopeptide (TPR) repeat protein
MNRNNKFLFIFVVIGLAFMSCGQDTQPNIPKEKIREFANELYGQYLFEQAIEQYKYYLDHYSVPAAEQANITYRIANIYFERLYDYQNALAAFLKIKTLYPESEIVGEANKKIIACLERLQRPEDAKQALSESVDLEPQKRESRSGTVIAVFSNREITQGDLDFEISQLPPEVRSQFQDREKKLEFLRRYIATELMYDSAKRAGLDKDKEVLENAFQAKKTFMVQKLFLERIRDRIKIGVDDIELFYKANMDRYADKDKDGKIIRHLPLSEIQQRVTQDLIKERQQKAYEEFMSSLLLAEDVKIFDDLVK